MPQQPPKFEDVVNNAIAMRVDVSNAIAMAYADVRAEHSRRWRAEIEADIREAEEQHEDNHNDNDSVF